MDDNMREFDLLPGNVQEFIRVVVKKVRYRKKVREDVFGELVGHFVDALEGVEGVEDRQRVGDELIAGFGEAAVLGRLIRRGKKRCRPMWKKALIVGVKLVCLMVLLVGLRIGSFYVGEPVVEVDYGKWLTEQVSAGKDPELNAKVDIDRAVELLVKEGDGFDIEIFSMWPGDMNEVQLEQAKKYLADNAGAIEAIRNAAEKPYFWMDFSNCDFREVSLHETLFGEQNSGTDYLKNATKCRHLVRWVMLLNCKFEIYNGDIEQWMNDVFVMQKVGEFLRGQGFLMDNLLGIAIEALSYKNIYEVLSRVEFSGAELAEIQGRVERVLRKDEKVAGWRGEKAIWLDEIQRGFTDDGDGDGRVLAKGLSYIAKDESSFIKGFLLGDYPGKKETIEEVERFCDLLNCYFEKTPFECHEKELKLTSSLVAFNDIVGGEAGSRIAALNWRFKTDGAALVVVVAVKRYELEKGHLPSTLKEVVEAGYLKEVPMDPFSGGALVYKVVDGDFVLYSVGMDIKDDGGKVEYTNSGEIQRFSKEGDYIFWPVRR